MPVFHVHRATTMNMANDGRLTLEEFTQEVMNFQAKSDLLHEGWTVTRTNSSPESIHLVKKIVKALPISLDKTGAALLPVCTSQESFDEEEEECDQKSLPTVLNRNVMITLEYHIIYSPVYNVPVLYFNAYAPSGKLLSLDELWSSIPPQYRGVDRWTFVTQQEHPLIGRPFFQLHPCHTHTMMEKLGKSMEKRYYLIRWLSAVGPAVHLDVSLGFANA